MRRKMSGWWKGLVALVAFGLLGLVACRPGEAELPFQTIAEGDSVGAPDGRGYSGEEPDLLVITALEQVDSPGMDIQFGADLADQLRAVDYEHNIVIVVFRGSIEALSSSYTVDILRVVRSRNQVVVRAHFGAPGPEEGSLSSFSSPYHIIAVLRQRMQEQKIRFILEVDGQVAKECTYFIPKLNSY
ncbi:MAG: protease complex subunit PrcB family protein [Anaerolineae bacterium]|jgi:hypothetical protein